jgi:hypothetical protein
MKTKAQWTAIAAIALLVGCGSESSQTPDAGKKDGPPGAADLPTGKDAPPFDQVPQPPEVQIGRDSATDVSLAETVPADRPAADAADRAPDLVTTEAGISDLAPPREAPEMDGAVASESDAVDLGPAGEVPGETSGHDGAPSDIAQEAADAPPVANFTCRNDSDCCIVLDSCRDTAYLYSKAPGATGMPSSLPSPSPCPPCVPPPVQVRCDLGQCVGEKVSGSVDYSSPLRSAHCGQIALPDAAAAALYQPAYAGAQQTSWTCG